MAAGRAIFRHHQIPPQDDDLDLGEAGTYANVVALSLSDLVPDRTGSIVIQTGGDNLLIELSGYEEVLKRGIAPDGSQSEHFDVSGLDFIKFLNGSVLYYAADEVHLVLSADKYPARAQASTVRSLSAVIDHELSDKHPKPHPAPTGKRPGRI